jgi:hypothetical protein
LPKARVRAVLDRFRERVALVGVSFVLVSLLGLFLAAAHQPTDAADAKGWRLGHTSYTVVTELLAVALGVGLISLAVELFVRESYAESLRKYVNLNEAAVRSRLQGLAHEPDAALTGALERASRITAVVRDPRAWVTEHLEAALRSARSRDAEIKIVVPDPAAAEFGAVAASLGHTPGELAANVTDAVKQIQVRWANAKIARPKSKINVVSAALISYDVCVVDDESFAYFGSCFDHRLGDQRLVLHVENDAYPGSWLADQAASDNHTGELWAGQGGLPAADPGPAPTEGGPA